MKLALHGGPPVIPPDAHRRWPVIHDADRAAVMNALDEGLLWGRQARQVKALEAAWAAYVGSRHCVASNSGTAALHMACAAAGVEPGDEVLVPAYTSLTTVTPVMFQGGIPVFVNIEPESFNIDPAEIEAHITPRTRAIVAVHVHGLPADMAAIEAIARRHDLAVIEDACQAHGAAYHGRKTGSLGDVAAFSLNATKGLVAGNGGLVTTDDPRLRDVADNLSVGGITPAGFEVDTHVASYGGHNYRTHELPAALALARLSRLDEDNTHRRRTAAVLDAGLNMILGVRPPLVPEGRTHAYHMYRVSLDTEAIRDDVPAKTVRDRLMAALRAEGVDVELWTGLLPALPGFRQVDNGDDAFPWRFARAPVAYDLEAYRPTYEVLSRSFVLYSALQPPNGPELAQRYVEAFEKVLEHADQLF